MRTNVTMKQRSLYRDSSILVVKYNKENSIGYGINMAYMIIVFKRELSGFIFHYYYYYLMTSVKQSALPIIHNSTQLY
jgi:hypothetical protein